jgi:hypothetical protein
MKSINGKTYPKPKTYDGSLDQKVKTYLKVHGAWCVRSQFQSECESGINDTVRSFGVWIEGITEYAPSVT